MAAATGAWVSFDDRDGAAIFSYALRHAVETSGKVAFWPFGMTLNDAIAAAGPRAGS